jgi:hypothetical protein
LAWIGAAVLSLAIFLWWALRRSCDAGRCQILNALLGAVLDAAADLGIIYLVVTNANNIFPNCALNGTVTAILPIVSLILMAILAGGHCTIDPIRLGSSAITNLRSSNLVAVSSRQGWGMNPASSQLLPLPLLLGTPRLQPWASQAAAKRSTALPKAGAKA